MKFEYIWIDATGNTRSKTRIIGNKDNYHINNKELVNILPEWNFDGSSTGQAPGNDSEVIIKPCSVFDDPFRDANSKLVLCDCYLPNGKPHITNKRFDAVKIFANHTELKPMFGIEQEFFLTRSNIPLGFEQNRNPKSQGDYYCGNGASNAIGRECIEDAFNNCLKAGINLTGMNAEVAPSQWEFQVCDYGIDVCDQLWVMRYILNRTAELYGWEVTFDPKPIEGTWNGSGCHTNFSTKPMRSQGGYDLILNAIHKLSTKHDYHMSNYGVGNEKRMTGEYETSDYNKFSYGVANRGCSVRIPRETEKNGKGYLEDRRPSSNMDPYVVTSLIYETTSL